MIEMWRGRPRPREVTCGSDTRVRRFDFALIARGFQPRRPIFSKLCRPERSGITSVANDSAKSRRSGLIEEQKTEAVTRITDGHVPDQVYEEVRPHFTDKELAALALAVATINAWNRLAIASAQFPEPTSPPRCMKWRRAA